MLIGILADYFKGKGADREKCKGSLNYYPFKKPLVKGKENEDWVDVYKRQNMRLPFGGKQLLFVGDVFQLEPVVPADQKEILSLFYEMCIRDRVRPLQSPSRLPIWVRLPRQDYRWK